LTLSTIFNNRIFDKSLLLFDELFFKAFKLEQFTSNNEGKVLINNLLTLSIIKALNINLL